MLVGGKEILDLMEGQMDFEKNQVNVGFFLLKPGRNFYIIRHEEKTYLYKDLIRCRAEQIPHCKFCCCVKYIHMFILIIFCSHKNERKKEGFFKFNELEESFQKRLKLVQRNLT